MKDYTEKIKRLEKVREGLVAQIDGALDELESAWTPDGFSIRNTIQYIETYCKAMKEARDYNVDDKLLIPHRKRFSNLFKRIGAKVTD